MGAEAVKNATHTKQITRITVLKQPTPPVSPTMHVSTTPTALQPIIENPSLDDDSQSIRSNTRRRKIYWKTPPPIQATRINIRTASPITKQTRSLSQSTTHSPLLSSTLSSAPSPLKFTRHAFSQSLTDSSPWMKKQRKYKLLVTRKNTPQPIRLPPPEPIVEPKSSDVTPNYRASRNVKSMLELSQNPPVPFTKTAFLVTNIPFQSENSTRMGHYRPRTPVKSEPATQAAVTPTLQPGSRAHYAWRWKGERGMVN